MEFVDGVLIVIIVILILRLNAIRILRFFRNSCPFCVESMSEWKKFKWRNAWNPLIKCIDVDTENDKGKELVNCYQIKGVPSIIKFDDNKMAKYNGDHFAVQLEKWVYD